MSNNLISVKELPFQPEYNSSYEINTTDVSYFTHGFFKYPCKFIPQVPRWAIIKYTKTGQNILDPFAGSGTSLVEAVLNIRNGFGIDFDKLSILLCNAKTKKLNTDQIHTLLKFIDNIHNISYSNKINYKPDIKNLLHWFPEENIYYLSCIKESIDNFYNEYFDDVMYNFLLVGFASIIRRSSFADDTSPKPYVSSRFKKEPKNAKKEFVTTLKLNLKKMEKYVNTELGESKIISEDARHIKGNEYNNKIDLVITSPPYINAFDYVRSLRLENAWLNFYGDKDIVTIKKRQIGTENIPSEVYKKKLEPTVFSNLDLILNKIHEKDERRSHIVHKYFQDMELSLLTIKKLLKRNSHCVIVIGDSNIRGIQVPTHEILIDIAKKNGFLLDNIFSYIIKNRYLRIPRGGRGGIIKKDWIIDLVNSYE